MKLNDQVNLQTASDLTYFAIPDVTARIKYLETSKAQAAAEQHERLGSLGEVVVTDAVGPDQINAIVAKMTGISVTRLRSSEKEKILHMENHLHVTTAYAARPRPRHVQGYHARLRPDQ